ncbi:MAG: PIN domain-containing protein [Scrofimicrobium sp.]
MPTLDTNLILRWLLDDVPQQTEAVDRLFEESAELVAPDVALVEAVFVLERVMKISRPTIVEGVNALMSRANVNMDRPLWASALEHYKRLPKLSIADIFLTLQAERDSQAPLLTFDRKLAKQMPSTQLV